MVDIYFNFKYTPTYIYIYIYRKSSNVNHFLVVNVRTAENASRGGDQSIKAALTVVPPFNSMSSHESRLVIRRGPNVASSHPPRVALSAVLTFTTKKWFTFEPDPIYIQTQVHVRLSCFRETGETKTLHMKLHTKTL